MQLLCSQKFADEVLDASRTVFMTEIFADLVSQHLFAIDISKNSQALSPVVYECLLFEVRQCFY
ncbi:hypothetical protein QUA41_08865 [Microcoleus sp. Pol11C1]|uniref:hypothetical protein n=1 Tax=Microcoleus sp. POL1_C1 TaxID=2818870 RepID=UPI002FCFDA56